MMDANERSPRIDHIAWGRMRVENLGTGKDFKLWLGGGREWNWRETDTHHSPGIQLTDVSELLAHGCRIVVLSRGMWLRLGVCDETLELLERERVEVRRAETKQAAMIYNELVACGERVGGLFHSTC